MLVTGAYGSLHKVHFGGFYLNFHQCMGSGFRASRLRSWKFQVSGVVCTTDAWFPQKMWSTGFGIRVEKVQRLGFRV